MWGKVSCHSSLALAEAPGCSHPILPPPQCPWLRPTAVVSLLFSRLIHNHCLFSICLSLISFFLLLHLLFFFFKSSISSDSHQPQFSFLIPFFVLTRLSQRCKVRGWRCLQPRYPTLCRMSPSGMVLSAGPKEQQSMFSTNISTVCTELDISDAHSEQQISKLSSDPFTQ